MSDDTVNKTGSVLSNLINSASTATTGTQKKANEAVSKDEFLKMLVTQLKNQDPMDPMKSDQFAVNLAQFSQLEQLVNINQTLSKGGGNDSLSSLAGFLGQEVTYNAETLQVTNHDGGRIRFALAGKAEDVKVALLNKDGSVKEEVSLGPVEAGKHSAALDKLNTASGEYKVRVTATGLNGQSYEVPANIAGIVTGFVPGADPTLLIGDREVKASEVKEVNLAGQ